MTTEQAGQKTPAPLGQMLQVAALAAGVSQALEVHVSREVPPTHAHEQQAIESRALAKAALAGNKERTWELAISTALYALLTAHYIGAVPSPEVAAKLAGEFGERLEAAAYEFDLAGAQCSDLDAGVLQEVADEHARNLGRWGRDHHAPSLWLTILSEEVGEAARSALGYEKGDPASTTLRRKALSNYRDELTQVAAVAVAAIVEADRELNNLIALPPSDTFTVPWPAHDAGDRDANAPEGLPVEAPHAAASEEGEHGSS